MTKIVTSEWSHCVAVESIENKPHTVEITASDAHCAAVAARLNAIAIKNMHAKLCVNRKPDGCTLHVTGNLHADVVQPCVATLDPVPCTVDTAVEGYFLDEQHATSFSNALRKKSLKEPDEAVLEREMLDESEDPEIVIGGQIDLGELCVQHISLALPLYPHKPGYERDLQDMLEKHAPKTSPFDVLAKIKE